jgi:serine protease
MSLLQKTSKTAIRFTGIAMIATLSSTAFAARYLVVMKNQNVFKQVHSQVSLSSGTSLSTLSVVIKGQPNLLFAGTDAVVEDSLVNLHTIVVNTNDPATLAAIKKSGQVAFIEKEFFHPAPRPVAGFHMSKPWNFSLQYATVQTTGDNLTVGSGGPSAQWGISAVNAPNAWNQANSGQGARVAIIDTGIDKDHPAIAPNFEVGRDFVRDGNQPYDFADKVGHGTHCAAVVAGVMSAQGFSGVAPKAHILSGRVCSDMGCSNIAVAEGIDWAVTEKVDVISMSLGGAQNSPAEEMAVMTADAAGIVIVAASGNDGKPAVSFPGAMSQVIAVGAVDSKSLKADFSNWGPELAVVAPGVDVISAVPMGSGRESHVAMALNGAQAQTIPSVTMSGAPEEVNAVSGDIVFVNYGSADDFKNLDLTGKFALIERGSPTAPPSATTPPPNAPGAPADPGTPAPTLPPGIGPAPTPGQLTFAQKVQNAIAAKAAGVIIFNNVPNEQIAGKITADDSIVSVPVAAILQTDGMTLVDQLSKGAKITASIQTVPTDYESMSGTSMATPHVAGVAALIRATNKNLRGADVKAILKQTAKPLPQNPNDQNQIGSGLVDAAAAVAAAATATPMPVPSSQP